MRSAIFLCFALVQIPVSLMANDNEEEKILARQLMQMSAQHEQQWFDTQVRQAVATASNKKEN